MMSTSIPRQRWSHVIPIAFIMYTIAFMDRINVGMALPSMAKDLHFSPTIGGTVFGIFFIGYLVLQIPGGHLAEKWSAKKFILTLLIIWGVFAIITGFVQNVTELLIARFFLGVAEGGVWPATLIFLSHWFPRDERARANNLWMLCLPVAAVVVSPLSGYILHVSNWHWLFILEGLPPWLWAILWAIYIKDVPSQARWISPEERQYIETTVSAERLQRDRPDLGTMRKALTSKEVWLLAVVYFFSVIPGYGIASFLPSLLKKGGFSTQTAGFITALPFVIAIIGLVVNGWLSDRSLVRRKFVIIPMLILGVGVVVSAFLESAVGISLVLLILAGYGLYAYLGPFWALVAQLLPPETAGGGMGLINAIGNLGGFFGPFIVGALDTATGSFLTGFLFLGVSAIAVAILISFVRIREGTAARVETQQSA